MGGDFQVTEMKIDTATRQRYIFFLSKVNALVIMTFVVKYAKDGEEMEVGEKKRGKKVRGN